MTPFPLARASLRLLPLVALISALGAFALLSAADPTPAQPKSKETLVDGQPLFAKWPKDQKPNAVLVLSGQTIGMIQPCGCSRPQLGGLERRAQFIDALKAKGWPVGGIDLGDLYPEKAVVRDQGQLKYLATMNALREMGYIAVGVGRTELAGGLDNLLGRYALQKEQPPFTLAANAVGVGVGADGKLKLTPRAEHWPVQQGFTRSLVGAAEVAEVGTVAVGVVGVVGASTAQDARNKKLDGRLDFAQVGPALDAALKELESNKKKPQLNVLIYQGTEDEAAKVAAAYPQFNVILCQSDPDAPAPLQPKPVTGPKHPAGQQTLIVQTGVKGQNIGVLGAFRDKDGKLSLHYQLVPLGEEFTTPGADDEALKANKALGALQEYAKAVKAEIRLGKDYPRVPHGAQIQAGLLNPAVKLTYVGSEACKACHEAEYAVWAKAPHSHAMDTLEKAAKRPNLRQFDGECVKCHSVGFEYNTGYKDAVQTPNLKHVGCENCHGPGSGHVADPKNKQLNELQVPWLQGVPAAANGARAKLPDNAFMEKMAKIGPADRGKEALEPATQFLLNRVGGMCMKCHDHEADPQFDLYKSWPKINHSGLAPKGGWPAVAPKK